MASSTATGARSLLILHFNDVCTYASSFAMCTHTHTRGQPKSCVQTMSTLVHESLLEGQPACSLL